MKFQVYTIRLQDIENITFVLVAKTQFLSQQWINNGLWKCCFELKFSISDIIHRWLILFLFLHIIYQCEKSLMLMSVFCRLKKLYFTHLCPFSKSKFNLNSDRVNLVAPASPIACLLYLPTVRAIQYKLGPERLTRLGKSNILRLPGV